MADLEFDSESATFDISGGIWYGVTRYVGKPASRPAKSRLLPPDRPMWQSGKAEFPEALSGNRQRGRRIKERQIPEIPRPRVQG